jgi:predicted Zn-dependent protease
MGYVIPEEAGFVVEDYEYGVQYLWRDEWKMASTNHFNGWYPTEKSAKNALAQLRATRYGYKSLYEYRLVRRPVGKIEVVKEVN